MYQYNAYVTKVYDGDTITVDIDLGFNIIMKGQTLRLFGINTPEVRGKERAEGLISRDWLREKILGKNITFDSVKDSKGKYGRWLADITTVNGEACFVCDELVELGLAEYRNY